MDFIDFFYSLRYAKARMRCTEYRYLMLINTYRTYSCMDIVQPPAQVLPFRT